ncbi:CapA family protein [Thermospira aquatica]|uniref:CapA family protein n=1 Tax=Thermospira aquatica TaxID=2828656 RepID=A0AAX3BF22_9SPIR|nr:CapA family protein [Thermospira aquatica]URA10728.1 CapA family protein [Thermospira aquatica]
MTSTIESSDPSSYPRESAVRIFLAGDVNFSRSITNLVERDIDPLLYVKRIIREADIAIVNLETTIATNGTPQTKTHVFRSPPEVLRFLTNAGVDIVSLANNHAMDYGAEAMFATRKHLQEYGILFTGAGSNWQDASRPLILTQKNITLAILCTGFQKPEELLATDKRPGTAGLRWKRILSLVTHLEKEVDYLIFFVHWGWEYVAPPLADEQISHAHALIDAGVDAIIGHHPHLIQGLEIYKGKPIFYSVGNFLFPQWEIKEARAAFAVVLDLQKTNTTIITHPYLIPIYRLSTTLQPIIAGGKEEEEVYQLVTSRSSLLGSNWILQKERKSWVPFWRVVPKP